MPFPFSEGQTSITILFCLSEQSAAFSGDHSFLTERSLNIPSPEQGASTIIMSKYPVRDEKAAGSLLVTIVFPCPHFVTFSARIPALDLITSFATSTPRLPINVER